jgi:hypothetical protein
MSDEGPQSIRSVLIAAPRDYRIRGLTPPVDGEECPEKRCPKCGAKAWWRAVPNGFRLDLTHDLRRHQPPSADETVKDAG